MDRNCSEVVALEGARATLRPWRAGDAASLALHANNYDIARHLRDRFPHPYRIEHAREYIGSLAGATPATSFAIVVDGEPAGAIGFISGSDVERYSAEIGYWLGERFWRRGIATEALGLASRYAFERCHMLRLFALPFADNLPSVRVLEKAGYIREATLRASCVKDGVPRDQALYALVNAAWEFRL